jgi:hypothetical protein
MVDIMLNFSTGMIMNKGRVSVNMNSADIRKGYLRGWFCLDVLATIPFDLVFQRTQSIFEIDIVEENTTDTVSTYIELTRGLKILKVLRLLRLGRFVRYLHRKGIRIVLG